MITFEVIGLPKPQGSKVAFNAGGGKARMKEAGGADHAAWRNQVASAARDIAQHPDVPAPLDGPLELGIMFRFPMPASRSKAVRAAGWCHKTSAPDLSKLIRAVEDSLQAANLIRDDARIVRYGLMDKIETTGWTGCVITIGTAF
jgi:Holliday junction resolvase RusA-like endonuclease